MMVWSPGGYKFTDFMRIGIPMDILLWVVATALIPIAWPL
jgi:di/tricarboxylate transporter